MADTQALISVQGMTCGACVKTVQTQVGNVDGVTECEVSLLTEECHVLFDKGRTTTSEILETIDECGFDGSLISEEPLDYDVTTTEQISGILLVSGMTCGACVKTVTGQVLKLSGVLECDVSLVTEECKVKFDPHFTSMAEIAECIDDCGFDAKVISENSSSVPSNEKRLCLKIFGMLSESDRADIESKVSELKGVISIDTSLQSEEATVIHDANEIGNRDIIDCIEEMGFQTFISNTLDNSTQLSLLSKTKEIQFWKKNCIRGGISSILIMGLYMCVPMLFPAVLTHFPFVQTPIIGLFYRDIIGIIITTYVQIYVGSYFYKAAWISLKHGSGTMDTLIGLSTVCAYIFSCYSIISSIYHKSTKMPKVIFDTAVMLLTFISLGKLLENKAKSETSTAMSKLISLTPSSCSIVLPDGSTREISVELLQPNDIVEVVPGMKIPADGVVIRNETEVDESLITGESMLVEKIVGSQVIGGSVNGPGHFYFRAIRVGEDTKLANIIATMKKAQLSKAPIQKYADKMAGIFVPFVISLSAITFITWMLVSYTMKTPPLIFNSENGKFFMCMQMSISVIIVACPCALGLAAPTAIMVGTGVGASHGVLIKGGDVLEKCSALQTFLFDKTGTLTTGRMSVENFINYNSDVSDLHWKMISLCESIGEHPVAKAIVNYADSHVNKSSIFDLDLSNEEVLIGKGISCNITDKNTSKIHTITIGNKKLFPDESLSDIASSTLTESYVSIDGSLVGKFEISDRVKEDAHFVVEYLQNLGIKCCMVTGDAHQSALKVAQQLGISANDVFSEVTPEQKRDIVIQLQNNGTERVAFVGDGINDSPALVEADLGISISSGTDIAIEAADIVILDSDNKNNSLKGLVYALDIARKTFYRVKLNFFWAVCYNTFMIPIAMGLLAPWGITLHPMLSSAAMALSSVSVVCSSLMLKRWTPPSLNIKSMEASGGLSWLRFGRNSNRGDDIELQERLM
ncbi:Cu(2+)-transporting P-type ATPase CCC2 [Kluyveromyces lactis]|uniref:P-type Cu(+) transporter n=1 Tax=Kluyveromyces lactis (strain ATCC 8585 / CBS 2359 / DSM 70799 / NBRC 1267 / NRRL Y-1140 / WM37) TaxID=284590 RepID=Q6CKX1_KLULA|nr:uncharacterized protein KLLA0_F07447g [Kluyveromyces lactis]CAG98126.1 KLLA0F07447p [Kluyveromyces lactis]|eukprot:XP_455418.1 uncharacterized protein KLLA0_F07447g [Kluyveromyces lactis]